MDTRIRRWIPYGYMRDNLQRILNKPIPLLSLEQQQNYVPLPEKIDELIANKLKMIELLKELRDTALFVTKEETNGQE